MSSAPVASAYVEIRPRLSENFEGDLRSQIQRDVSAASKGLGSAPAAAAARPLSTGATAGQVAALGTVKQGERELAAATAALAAADVDLTTKNDKLSQSHERVAIHAHRSQIAGFTLRGTTVGIGAAAVVAAEGLHKLAEGLKTTGDEAATTEGRLKNAAAAALSGDFATAAQRLGEQAAFTFQPGASQAAQEAQAAQKRDADVQKAIALAAEFVKVREQAAKATGQQGTAEGVVKFQLEQQLRILKAQLAALPAGLNKVAFGQLGLGPGGTRNQGLVDRTKSAGQPTDLDFQLAAAKAKATKTSSDDLELFRSRKQFLTGLVKRTEAAGVDTVEAKTNLKRLYGLLADADQQVTSLQKDSLAQRQQKLLERVALQQTELSIQEANARNDSQEISALRAQQALATKLSTDRRLDAQTRADYALQAAQTDKQVFEINKAAAATAAANAKAAAAQREQDRKEALAKLKAKREEAQQLGELRLSNAESAAGLTKRTSDDKKAIQRSIAYYKGLVANTKGLEREQARASLISAKGRLQGLTSGGQQGATTAEFFAKAAQQFGEFGSNIAGRDGMLSGQDARGRFAGLALQGKESLGQSLYGALEKTARPQLTEAQRQTVLLRQIAHGVSRFGPSGAIRDRLAIVPAREKATFLGGV